MARRRTPGGGGNKNIWLISYCDLMTLLLTFFVLLLSMAVIDERTKLTALGSVSKAFGVQRGVSNPLSERFEESSLEPGPMEGEPEDLAPLRDMLFDDVNKDLDFRENKYVQILSINDEVLFKPGGTELSMEGTALLDRILPYLQRISYPLLIAGHTAARRDEEAGGYALHRDEDGMDSTWPLSYHRALSVYRHLGSRGISPGRLSLEAFGQFHSRFSNNTPDGRRKNRRVDLVLDKRNRDWIDKVEALRQEKAPDTDVYYKGFRFDLTMPGSGLPGGRP